MGSTVGMPAPYASPPPRRGWLLPTVIVVVVVIVLVAALFATGILRIGAASSSSPADETFAQAESVATAGSGSVAGGPWFAAFGVGIATPAAVLEPVTNLSQLLSSLNCTIAWPNGEPSNLAIPATAESASVGTAAYWTFGLKNASDGLLLESVANGVASAVLTAGGGTCSEVVAYLAAFPTGVVNSPAVVTTANENGGSAFLETYPNATRAFGAYGGAEIGGLGSTSPLWYVEYTSCSLPPYSGEMGAVFNATIGGTSGVLIANHTGTAECEPTVPTDLALPLTAGSSPVAVRKAI